MPVYKFAFAPDAAGLDVTIKNARTGSTVTTGEVGASVDVDGVVTFSAALDEGLYFGEVEAPGDGLNTESHPSRLRISYGTLDIPASIGEGGGSGTIHDGSVFELEYNAGTDEIPDSNTGLIIPFDDISEGVEDEGNGTFTLPTGLYVVKYDIEPSRPDEVRYGSLTFSIAPNEGETATTASLYITVQPTTVFESYGLAGQVLVSGGALSVNVKLKSVATGGDPLTLDYAYIQLTKVG